jgi:hypothetical protein
MPGISEVGSNQRRVSVKAKITVVAAMAGVGVVGTTKAEESK